MLKSKVTPAIAMKLSKSMNVIKNKEPIVPNFYAFANQPKQNFKELLQQKNYSQLNPTQQKLVRNWPYLKGCLPIYKQNKEKMRNISHHINDFSNTKPAKQKHSQMLETNITVKYMNSKPIVPFPLEPHQFRQGQIALQHKAAHLVKPAFGGIFDLKHSRLDFGKLGYSEIALGGGGNKEEFGEVSTHIFKDVESYYNAYLKSRMNTDAWNEDPSPYKFLQYLVDHNCQQIAYKSAKSFDYDIDNETKQRNEVLLKKFLKELINALKIKSVFFSKLKGYRVIVGVISYATTMTILSAKKSGKVVDRKLEMKLTKESQLNKIQAKVLSNINKDKI